jgi:D-xylose transport system ATP-binding protein
MSATSPQLRPTVAADAPLLAVRGATKRYGAVLALDGVDLEVRAAEVVALLGDNGAGKSTLIKALSGAQPADSGTIRMDGVPVTIRSPLDARRLGIATVYQDLALADNLDVVANLFLGTETHTRGLGRLTGTLDEAAMEQRTRELLHTLSVGTLHDVRAAVGRLSGGQRQSVAIARSLLGDPRLVILDEPTAALGVAETAEVLGMIHRLREQGLGVVVISHNLDTVFEVADRIVVLRLGRRVATFERAYVRREQVVAAILGANAAEPVSV